MGIFYSATTRGFYDTDIHTSMPEDVVEITAERHIELLQGQATGQVIAPDAQGAPALQTPSPGAPQSVSMRQARLALLTAGLLGDVNVAVQQGSAAAQIEWEYAQTVDRNSPLVQSLTSALSLTSAQVDGLFALAASL